MVVAVPERSNNVPTGTSLGKPSNGVFREGAASLLSIPLCRLNELYHPPGTFGRFDERVLLGILRKEMATNKADKFGKDTAK
jgi:hypothetical protein